MWLIDSGPVLTCGRTSRASGTETTLLVAHPQQVQVVQSCALAIEKFEDDPIDVEEV